MSSKEKAPKRGKKAFLAYSSILMGAAAALVPTGVQAQDTTAQANASDEEIVVVGSRIRRDNFNSPAPVQIITREESTRAGFTSTAQVLQSAGASGGTAQLNNNFSGLVTDGGGGVNTLGLRGFGPTSTLILLNGRRLTPAGTTGSVGAADLNVIPDAMIDRIEILKDGASSVYGSDAVAGVVNIITRENMDELNVTGQYNFNEEGGGETSRLSVAYGNTWDRLSVSGSIDYLNREAVTFADREWAACPRDVVREEFSDYYDDFNPVTGEIKCHTANFANSGGVTINTVGLSSRPGFGGPGTAGDGANFTRFRPIPGNADGAGGYLDGFEGVNGGGLTGLGNRDTFEPRQNEQHLFNPTENINVFLNAQYDIGGGHEVYGELLVSHRKSGSPLYRQLTLDYPNSPILLSPDMQLGGPLFADSTVANPPPSGVPGSLMPAGYATQARAFIGFGTTEFEENVLYTRGLAGVRGDFMFEDWRYDLNIYYGRNDADYDAETFLTDRIFNSLVVTDAIPTGTPTELIRQNPDGVSYICAITATNPAYGCIPAPALTGAVIGGAIPQDYRDWILYNSSGNTQYDEYSIQFVIDGPLLDLPAGSLAGAFGVEYRSAEIDDTPDQNALDNNFYGLSSGLATRGEDTVAEIFGELEAPILRDQPFAQDLTLNVSGRYTDYDSYGADSTYKVTGSWTPVDTLTFRATQGTSYRAPALFEQFLGFTSGFQGANFDPCDDYGAGDPSTQVYQNCDAEIGDPTFQQNNGVTIFSGGGAAQGLSAETSENTTIGVTWQPLADVDSWGELSVAIDQFNIEVDGQVTKIGEVDILALCYGSEEFATEQYCSFVDRDSLNRLTVFDNYVNIATQISEGYDYQLRYAHALGGGIATLDLQLTQYTGQKSRLFAVDEATGEEVPFDDFNGTVGAPEYVGEADVNWETGPWNFRYGVTWINEMSNYDLNGEDPNTSGFILGTPEFFIHDASVQFSQDDWELTAGVRNFTDEQPPDYSAIDPNVNRIGRSVLFSGYEALYYGRQFFVSLSKTF